MAKLHLMSVMAQIQGAETPAQKLALAWADALCFPRFNRGRPVSGRQIQRCLAAIHREFHITA